MTQVALAFVLLTSTGLLLRSVEKLLATEPGFDAQHVLTMQVVATGRRYGSFAELAQFYERALDAVRGLPGVTDAAFTSQLPLSGDSDFYGVVFESDARGDRRNPGGALRYVVTPDWFATMRIPLLEGRLLGAEDKSGAPQVVLINASFARRRFGAAEPDRAASPHGPVPRALRRPVGHGGRRRRRREADVARARIARRSLLRDGPVALGRRRAIARDPGAHRSGRARAERRARDLVSRSDAAARARRDDDTDLLEASEAQRSFALVVFGAFALTAVVLAVVGLYGVVSRSVEERRRELGVRAALGASPGRVAALVIRQGMTLAGAGIVVGVLGSAAATRALSSLLFGVSPIDAFAFGGTIAVLAGVALLACGVPAARAARVDPAITLRAD